MESSRSTPEHRFAFAFRELRLTEPASKTEEAESESKNETAELCAELRELLERINRGITLARTRPFEERKAHDTARTPERDFVKITLASGEAAKVIQHRKRCRFYCASLVVPIDTVNGSNAHPLHVRYNGDDRSVSDDRVSDMDSPGSKSLSRSSRSPLSPQPMPSP